MEAVAVEVFDPIINLGLFLGYGILTLGFIANSIINYDKYNRLGKCAFILSVVPLIALVVYGVQYGFWVDEVGNLNKPYAQYGIGSDMSNDYLIFAILLNVFAYVTKDNPKL